MSFTSYFVFLIYFWIPLTSLSHALRAISSKIISSKSLAELDTASRKYALRQKSQWRSDLGKLKLNSMKLKTKAVLGDTGNADATSGGLDGKLAVSTQQNLKTL